MAVEPQGGTMDLDVTAYIGKLEGMVSGLVVENARLTTLIEAISPVSGDQDSKENDPGAFSAIEGDSDAL